MSTSATITKLFSINLLHPHQLHPQLPTSSSLRDPSLLDSDTITMPRPHQRDHVPTKSPSIQPSSTTNQLSPILNRPNQIIEIINDSSSPSTPRRNPPQLPPLLNRHPTQTTHTMSSEHQRTQYQPPDVRRRSDERRQWSEPHPRPDAPPPSHVFHLSQTTIYSQPYGYTSNGEPLYLQFGTHRAAEAARILQSFPAPSMPPGFADPRDDYPPYRPPRQYEDDRYEPYEGHQRNYESYDRNRETERRGFEAPRRGEEFEGVRYRHSTGQGSGPVAGAAPAAGAEREACNEETEEYGGDEDDETGEIEKRRQRLPATRTYRDFSNVPSVSGQSEERKRQYSSEDLRGKRARLNWSDELHSKFLEAVEELGVDKAVPTSIMKLMKVDGLTRENVASHLQKFRGTIKKEKEEEERRLLLKAAAKSVLEDGGGKMTEEEVIKAVAEREESYKAPAKKRVGKDR